MPYPVLIEGALPPLPSGQRVGPYEYGTTLYVVAFSTLPEYEVEGILQWWKSTDEGITWSTCGTTKSVKSATGLESPAQGIDSFPDSDFPSTPHVYVLYVDTSSSLHCSVFDVSTETWVGESTNDAHVYLETDDSMDVSEFHVTVGASGLPGYSFFGVAYGETIHVGANLSAVGEALSFFDELSAVYARVYSLSLDVSTLTWTEPVLLPGQANSDTFDYIIKSASAAGDGTVLAFVEKSGQDEVVSALIGSGDTPEAGAFVTISGITRWGDNGAVGFRSDTAYALIGLNGSSYVLVTSTGDTVTIGDRGAFDDSSGIAIALGNRFFVYSRSEGFSFDNVDLSYQVYGDTLGLAATLYTGPVYFLRGKEISAGIGLIFSTYNGYPGDLWYYQQNSACAGVAVLGARIGDLAVAANSGPYQEGLTLYAIQTTPTQVDDVYSEVFDTYYSGRLVALRSYNGGSTWELAGDFGPTQYAGFSTPQGTDGNKSYAVVQDGSYLYVAYAGASRLLCLARFLMGDDTWEELDLSGPQLALTDENTEWEPLVRIAMTGSGGQFTIAFNTTPEEYPVSGGSYFFDRIQLVEWNGSFGATADVGSPTLPFPSYAVVGIAGGYVFYTVERPWWTLGNDANYGPDNGDPTYHFYCSPVADPTTEIIVEQFIQTDLQTVGSPYTSERRPNDWHSFLVGNPLESDGTVYVAYGDVGDGVSGGTRTNIKLAQISGGSASSSTIVEAEAAGSGAGSSASVSGEGSLILVETDGGIFLVWAAYDSIKVMSIGEGGAPETIYTPNLYLGRLNARSPDGSRIGVVFSTGTGILLPGLAINDPTYYLCFSPTGSEEPTTPEGCCGCGPNGNQYESTG